MILKIKNCNNIDDGTISIDENKLNIKYAMNGAGKSTVARAIELHAKGDGSISQLTPFKFLKSLDQKPEILGLDKVSSVAVFNDTYINQFAFQQDEILANSFDIFVKTPDYEKHMSEINKIVSGIKSTFHDSNDIEQIISDLTKLSASFGKAKSGYSEAGALAKALGKGNKIANVPKELESFTAYLKSSLNFKWLKWHMDGTANFSKLHENCPYCSSPTIDKQGVISQVNKEFDPKSVEHLADVLTVLENLKSYLSKDANLNIAKITGNIKGLSKEEINYLLELKSQADTLRDKMLFLKNITYFSMKDESDKVSELISKLKINLTLLPHLKSSSTSALVDKINGELDGVLSRVGFLQGEIAKQNTLVRETIEVNKQDINGFLKYAGYKYHVEVEYTSDDQSYKMRLRHIDFAESVKNGSQHLSYGEKNAFALVLFMYECLSKNHDVIILDDPISSFDRNKKYAVIDMLFRGVKSLRDKTVLLMTHDLEPIIDITFNFPDRFAERSNASFFESKGGIIKEIPIKKSDVQTFGLICKENARDAKDVVKIVYLRRLYQVLNDKGTPYQILSSLLHKKETPTKLGNNGEEPLTETEVSEAINKIKEEMPSFDYKELLKKLSDEDYMKTSFKEAVCNYEKLHLFRIMKGHFPENDVINKIINETFHIENEYIMQINPRKYEIVPSFVIDECNKILFSPGDGR